MQQYKDFCVSLEGVLSHYKEVISLFTVAAI